MATVEEVTSWNANRLCWMWKHRYQSKARSIFSLQNNHAFIFLISSQRIQGHMFLLNFSSKFTWLFLPKLKKSSFLYILNCFTYCNFLIFHLTWSKFIFRLNLIFNMTPLIIICHECISKWYNQILFNSQFNFFLQKNCMHSFLKACSIMIAIRNTFIKVIYSIRNQKCPSINHLVFFYDSCIQCN